jgi:amidohydrolase
MKKNLLIILLLSSIYSFGQSALKSKINTKAESIDSKVVAWRRDIHQNPELGNREFKTAEKIAAHLKSLGIEVQEKVAYTGVVGILKGGKPGPVVLLRADMDGLPVTERADIPYKSNVITEYNNQKTGVMHACGHDTHVAILMGVAEVLSSMKNDLAGTVKFCFQPAEEGAPAGEEGGAALMIKQGVMENPKVDVAFGLHINSGTEVGKIRFRSGPEMAAADTYTLKIKGNQTHGASPWSGIDPIVTGSQIVMAFQTIISRNVDITENPAIVTVGAFNAGIRSNIIPEDATLIGTIRTFSETQQTLIHRRMQEIATNIAESAGATADLKINIGVPVTYNDPTLTEKMTPTLTALAGKENILPVSLATGAEDFSFFGKKVPAFFFFLGGKPIGSTAAAPHHTPDFFIDDSGLGLGVKALCHLTVDYLEKK